MVDYFGENREQSYQDLLESLKHRQKQIILHEVNEKEQGEQLKTDELIRKQDEGKERLEGDESLKREIEEQERKAAKDLTHNQAKEKASKIVNKKNEKNNPNKQKGDLVNKKAKSVNVPVKKSLSELSQREKKHSNLNFTSSKRSTSEKSIQNNKQSLSKKSRLRIGLLFGILDPIAIAIFDHFGYMPDALIVFVLLGLILGSIAAVQINSVENNQSSLVGGKAGLIVNAISGVSHQIALPFFMVMTPRHFFSSVTFLNLLGGEGLILTVIYLVPALIAGYISGYLTAKPKANKNTTIK